MMNNYFEEKDIERIKKKNKNLTEKQFNQKLKEYQILGYTKEEALSMIKKYPIILRLSIRTMINKINNLMLLDFTKEEALHITYVYPQIYTDTMAKIQSKINLYKDLGLKQEIIKNPHILSQSLILTKARLNYFKENNITNYKLLFIENKKFERIFKITRQELLNKYQNKEMIK